MLALQKQPKYIQKTVQLPNGAWALVIFELIEVNGKITAKAVCGKILGNSNPIENSEVLALPVYFERESIEPVVSPFFSEIKEVLKDLAFIVSQPIRAPSIS